MMEKRDRSQSMESVPLGEASVFTVNEAKDVLNRIIGFINTCDMKASVLLGAVGVVITLFFTTQGITVFLNTMDALDKNLSCFYPVLLLGASLSIALLLFGTWQLITVLKADVKPSGKGSILYFKDISENKTYDDYLKKARSVTGCEYLEDFISEIYINSKICTQKYEKYNSGLHLCLIGVLLFALFFIAGLVVRP